jgi:hypothetical protein
MYKSINGYIINIYYGPNIFIDVEYFTAPLTYRYILLHIIFCKIFNKLFTKIENGVYKKKDGITVEEYNHMCDEEYSYLKKILEEKQLIIEFLPESYFENLKKIRDKDDEDIEIIKKAMV